MADRNPPASHRNSDTQAFLESHKGFSNISEDPMDLEEQKELYNTISSLSRASSRKVPVAVVEEEEEENNFKEPPALGKNPSYASQKQPVQDDAKKSNRASISAAAGGAAAPSGVVATASTMTAASPSENPPEDRVNVDEQKELHNTISCLGRVTSQVTAVKDEEEGEEIKFHDGPPPPANNVSYVSEERPLQNDTVKPTSYSVSDAGGAGAIATAASTEAPTSDALLESPDLAQSFSKSFHDEAVSAPKASGIEPANGIQINFTEPKVQQTPKSAGTIFGMSRVAFGLVSLLAMGGAGLATWTGMKVGDQNSQIDELEAQVDRLTQEVDELAVENERFQSSNDALNASVTFFQEQNKQLRKTSIQLAASVVKLNQTIDTLQVQVVILENITQTYSIENDKLNETNAALQEDVDTLNSTVTSLDEQNQLLNETINNLQYEIESLEGENDALNQTEQHLSALLNVTTEVNDQLNQSLQSLDTLIQYLNESINGTQQEQIEAVSNLAASIEVNRMLGVEQLNLAYLDYYHNWDCTMADKFLPEFRNDTAKLDNTTLHLMLADMTTATGLVTQSCLNNTNYQEYLNYWHDIVTPKITTEQFVDGTDTYSLEALAYMFPNSPSRCGIGNVTCLSLDQWEIANYTCQGITNNNLQYYWTLPTL